MVKHLVFWKLKDFAHGNSKAENARIIKSRLEALNGKMPGMKMLEVGIDFSATESSADLALYSEFDSREALDNYVNHPDHKAVIPFITEARSERRVADYEC